MSCMATPVIKTTYALDAETVRAAAEAGEETGTPLQALDRLQRAARLPAARVRKWAGQSRSERRAASARRAAWNPTA